MANDSSELSLKDPGPLGGGSALSEVHRERRRFLKAALAMVGGGSLIWRFLAYPFFSLQHGMPLPQNRVTLTASEWVTLTAVFDAISGETDPVEIQEAVSRVDRLIATLSKKERLELAGAWVVIEQMAGGGFERFSSLAREDRFRCLQVWGETRGVKRDIFLGMKELMAVGFYSGESRWEEIQYAGPIVPLIPDSDSPEREKLLENDPVFSRFWAKSEGES